MSQIKIHLILSTFFLFFLEIHAQNEFLEDSKKLIEQYEESNTEAEKIALLYKLIPQLLSENSSDASKYIDIFSSFVKRDWDKVNYYIYQGSLLLEAGKIDSSLQKFYQAESISRKLKDDKLLSRTLYNISEAY